MALVEAKTRAMGAMSLIMDEMRFLVLLRALFFSVGVYGYMIRVFCKEANNKCEATKANGWYPMNEYT